jgi:E3 ubiquitin-protein ligase NEDD4
MQIDRSDMLKIFRIEFIGEPGLDAGGVSREWYQLISEAIFNPDHGLFLYSSINQMCMQINPNSGIANEHHLRYYNLLGRLLGKSLMDGQITPVHLVQPIYKHMMGWPVTLHDLECLDDMVYRNLIGMRDMTDISALFLEFNVTEDHLGSTVNVELVPGGSDILVTDENLPAYLEAQLRYRLVDRTKSQLAELLKGFYEVVPEPLLSVFDFQELELLLHGLPVIDMDDWIKNTDYTGDLHGQPNHKVVTWFWDTVREFDDEKKAKLLQFVTGTSGVPSKGFAYLQGNDANIRRFTVHGDKSLSVFPRSHTCFNRIDMPMYKTKADLQKYLTLAISTECSGFGIE